MVLAAQIFNPSTLESEAGDLSSRPSWSTEPIPGQQRSIEKLILEKQVWSKTRVRYLEVVGAGDRESHRERQRETGGRERV